MHLGRVIGTVWASQKDGNFVRERIQLVAPVRVDASERSAQPRLVAQGEPLAALDTQLASPGDLVFFVTAREAIIAAKGEATHLTPVDAAIVGLVDSLQIDPQAYRSVAHTSATGFLS